jgi:pantoate--beta-alanine ligase
MTKCIEDINEWRALRSTLKTPRIGFVPTMGNLHAGHLSLCQQSKQENDLTMVSLFVNPTQFNQESDYLHYPKTLKADLQQLEALQVDYCMLPTVDQLYPDHYHYRIEENLHANQLEGKSRPGHYTGVLTVVMKLLQLVKPHQVYLGEKDFQQYQLIKNMVDAFFMDIQVHVGPTIREPSGLAYSSRNNRLSSEEKKQAEKFARIFHQPHKTIDDIQLELEQANIKLDYIETHQNRRFIAVYIGEVRLIDNYCIG